jgi:predicted nucleic acid-binding protein
MLRLILDTNVIAEFMKPTVNDSVKEWLNDQAIETLYLTSVTVAELSYGVEALEDGRQLIEMPRYTGIKSINDGLRHHDLHCTDRYFLHDSVCNHSLAGGIKGQVRNPIDR